MSTDAGGHPYIATYWRNPDSDVPQYRIVWHDGVNWHNRQVSERKTPFSLKGGGTKMIPMSRPRMVVDNGEVYYLFRDQERGSKVSMYYTKDIQFGEWHVKDLTDFAVNAWEPSHDMENEEATSYLCTGYPTGRWREAGGNRTANGLCVGVVNNVLICQ